MLPLRVFALLLPATLALSSCTQPPVPAQVRPAMVVRAGGGSAGLATFAGEVRAREEPLLAFRIGGKMTRRLVDTGAHVEAGQLLAELDAGDVLLAATAARAQVASAQADLALAQSEMQRYRQLADQQLVARSQYDSRLAAFHVAQSRLGQVQAQSASAGNQAGYAQLRSPRSGVIAQRFAEAGQVVAAGQPVFELAVDGDREVLISVSEHDIGQFTVGRPLAIELWSAPGSRFEGRLREIAPAADPQTRTYLARVSFTSADVPITLGQSARVFAQTPGISPVQVPLSALTQRGGRPAVWVVDPRSSRVRLTAITTGAYGEDGVPVLSGLRANEWVVAAGAHLLIEGEKIQPIDRDNRPVMIDGASGVAGADSASTRSGQ